MRVTSLAKTKQKKVLIFSRREVFLQSDRQNSKVKQSVEILKVIPESNAVIVWDLAACSRTLIVM